MVYFLGVKVQRVSERHVQVDARSLENLICTVVKDFGDLQYLLYKFPEDFTPVTTLLIL